MAAFLQDLGTDSPAASAAVFCSGWRRPCLNSL